MINHLRGRSETRDEFSKPPSAPVSLSQDIMRLIFVRLFLEDRSTERFASREFALFYERRTKGGFLTNIAFAQRRN